MTAPTPEKVAPIPSVEILDGFRPEPAIDTALFITPARMRFLVARATMPYSTADDVERSIREAIEGTVRVIKQHLADREARPSRPDSREERIREDERGIEWFERTFGVPLGDRPGAADVAAVRARARQRGDNGRSNDGALHGK